MYDLRNLREMLCKELDDIAGRTPQGVRGLKSGMLPDPEPGNKSHPARGAWIEITTKSSIKCEGMVAPRKGCVD